MANNFDTSLKNVASKYLQLLKVKVAKSSLERRIEEHPYYPSLLSLSDTFNRFRIDNNAFEIPAGDLEQIKPPYVAFARIPGVGRDFLLVINVTEATISYLYKGKKMHRVPKVEFLKQYENIVWVAEANARSEDVDFEKGRRWERRIKVKQVSWITGIVALFLIVILGNLRTESGFAFFSIVMIKLIGILLTIFLLVYETDKSNAFVKDICATRGQRDCDAIIHSKASKIMGVSWAEIGFFYFAATALWLGLPFVLFESKVVLIAFANVCAIPYILFSVYYQGRIAKQWCRLCLGAQAILFLEFIWGILFFWDTTKFHFTFSPSQLLTLLFCMLFPILSWYGLKPIFLKAKDANLYRLAYKRLQFNPEVFFNLLQQQTKAPDGWQYLGISIGNPQGSNIILKVCNPYCGPCAQMHPVLKDLIKANEDIQIRIIFTTYQNDSDNGFFIVRHLMAIAEEGDASKTRQSLDDWYTAEKKEYDFFAAKYLTNGGLGRQDSKIEAMRKWCDDAEITHTPTIFVNGYKLPDNYNADELQYIL